MSSYEYHYKIIRENIVTGEQSGRCKVIVRYIPLKVGGIYSHLRHDLKGFWRVLEMVKQVAIEE